MWMFYSHLRPSSTDDLCTQHNFKLGTKDRCYYFSIWSNVKYGPNLLPVTEWWWKIPARKVKAGHRDTPVMSLFDHLVLKCYDIIIACCLTFVGNFETISIWIFKFSRGLLNRPQWSWPLTSDQQKQIGLSWSPIRRLSHIWRNCLKLFLRKCVHRHVTDVGAEWPWPLSPDRCIFIHSLTPSLTHLMSQSCSQINKYRYPDQLTQELMTPHSEGVLTVTANSTCHHKLAPPTKALPQKVCWICLP